MLEKVRALFRRVCVRAAVRNGWLPPSRFYSRLRVFIYQKLSFFAADRDFEPNYTICIRINFDYEMLPLRSLRI
jgi:hypothetical protein